MNEALNEAVHERFRFIEGRLYWLQFIRFFRGPFNVQMLHIPALKARVFHRRLVPSSMPLTNDFYFSLPSLLTAVEVSGAGLGWMLMPFRRRWWTAMVIIKTRTSRSWWIESDQDPAESSIENLAVSSLGLMADSRYRLESRTLQAAAWTYQDL